MLPCERAAWGADKGGSMSGRAQRIVNKGVPWSGDVWWPIVVVEAVALIGIGGFMLIATGTAGDIVLQLIGVTLLIASLLVSIAGFRDSAGIGGFIDAFRAGVGVACGMIATASWWSDYIQSHAVRMILGWGLVAWTILHVVGLLLERGRANVRLSTIAFAVLSLVLGILLLTGDDTASEGRVRLLGVALLVGGLVLGGLAYYNISMRDGGRTGSSARPSARS